MFLKMMVLGSLLVGTAAQAGYGKKEAVADITNDLVRRMVQSFHNAGGTTATAKNITMNIIYGGQSNDVSHCAVKYEYNYNIMWRWDEQSNKETIETKESVVVSAISGFQYGSTTSQEPVVASLRPFLLKYMDYNPANHSFSSTSITKQRGAGIGDIIGSFSGVPFNPGRNTNYTAVFAFNDSNMVRAYEITDNRNNSSVLCEIDNSHPIDAEGRIVNDDNSYGGGWSMNMETGRFEQWKAAD